MDNKNLTYKSFVCVLDKDCLLFVKEGKKFVTIPILIPDSFGDNFDEVSAKISLTKFYDGLDLVSLDYALENEFEDIFFAVDCDAVIDFEGDEFNLDNIQEIWEVVEEYYKTDSGKKRYDEYAQANAWEEVKKNK